MQRISRYRANSHKNKIHKHQIWEMFGAPFITQCNPNSIHKSKSKHNWVRKDNDFFVLSDFLSYNDETIAKCVFSKTITLRETKLMLSVISTPISYIRSNTHFLPTSTLTTLFYLEVIEQFVIS